MHAHIHLSLETYLRLAMLPIYSGVGQEICRSSPLQLLLHSGWVPERGEGGRGGACHEEGEGDKGTAGQ
jgi:hypothetical protein